MTDYISRDAVLELVEPDARPFLAERIRNIPSADVAPVRHGKWINQRIDSEMCSNCGVRFYISALFAVGGNDEPNYCPNCGTKMEVDG